MSLCYGRIFQLCMQLGMLFILQSWVHIVILELLGKTEKQLLWES